MANVQLWDQWNAWKKTYEWVDLTHELSPDTPHWDGFPPLTQRTVFDLDSSIFQVYEYTCAGQYGTHVDAPAHMVKGARPLDAIKIDEMVMPLCVIDKSDAVKMDADYTLKVEDIAQWETVYGKIPSGAFVAFRSDWAKRGSDMDNRDSDGQKHYPGWSLDAIKFLVEQRNIGAIGHETTDTDSAVDSPVNNYAGELYILSQNRFQIEVMANLDKCPPVGSLIFCTFPKVKGGTGYPSRCFALCPKE